MKKLTFLALAMSLGLMTIEQAGATVANPGIASAATATQTGAVTKVWWRGGPGWYGGWHRGYAWGWAPRYYGVYASCYTWGDTPWGPRRRFVC